MTSTCGAMSRTRMRHSERRSPVATLQITRLTRVTMPMSRSPTVSPGRGANARPLSHVVPCPATARSLSVSGGAGGKGGAGWKGARHVARDYRHPEGGRDGMFVRTLDGLAAAGMVKTPGGGLRSGRSLTAADGMGFSYNDNQIG